MTPSKVKTVAKIVVFFLSYIVIGFVLSILIHLILFKTLGQCQNCSSSEMLLFGYGLGFPLTIEAFIRLTEGRGKRKTVSVPSKHNHDN